MPSRAELRSGGEWLLRLALVALLAIALRRSMQRPARRAERRAATTATLGLALRDATRAPEVAAIDLAVDSVPSPAQRAWLAALRGAGVRIAWRGGPPPMAVAAARVREPDAAVRVLLAADARGPVSIADSAGMLDAVLPRGGGAALEAGEVVGAVSVRRGPAVAAAPLPDAPATRAVLLLGRMGWEEKFVAAALGEAGWTVRARIPAAPGVDVSDPELLPIDTARYDVVVALDSTAADLAPSVVRFVSAGGGLVAAGSATSLPAFRALVPAQAGVRRPGRILLDADTATPRDLPIRPLGALRADAVPLERQLAGLALAARRAGLGRAIAVGYDESWRWRMLGGASGPAAHRRWWSRTVGLAAPEREGVAARPIDGDAAPVAALVAAVGLPSAGSAAAQQSGAPSRLPIALLLLIAAALLAETASRRFRGAR
jgi:hypothetical protein